MNLIKNLNNKKEFLIDFWTNKSIFRFNLIIILLLTY